MCMQIAFGSDYYLRNGNKGYGKKSSTWNTRRNFDT